MAYIAAVHRRINGLPVNASIQILPETSDFHKKRMQDARDRKRGLMPLNIEELIGLYLEDLMTFQELLNALPGAGYQHTIIERRK